MTRRSSIKDSAAWLACASSHEMLTYLKGKASRRKLQLFAAACCRRIWPLLSDQRSRYAVEITEAFADEQATISERKTARAGVYSAVEEPDEDLSVAEEYAVEAAANVAYAAYHPWIGTWLTLEPAAGAVGAQDMVDNRANHVARKAELAAQCSIARDVFGNPFRPISLWPACLAWNDGAIPKLAQAIYDDRTFDRLPLLADPLEEAGCDNREILAHCRSGGEHVRGCWVVDLLLGKS